MERPVIAQKTDAGERMDFLYDDKGNVFAVDYKDKLYFYQTNLQGDITGIVDSNGKQVVTYTYDSWGKLLASTDNSGVDLAKKNPFRYRGYYYDVETGFYYLNDRYYDPKARRMLSADDNINLMMSIEFYGKNLYLYCDNNPVSRRDSEGEFWYIVAGGAVSAAVGMATTIAENMADGNDWKDGLVEAAVTGFISGAIAGSGLGLTAQNVAQAALTIATDGYDLWQKSKTKEGITAYDVTFAVADVAFGVVEGIPKKKKANSIGKGDVEKWADGRRAIKEYHNSANNYKISKKGKKAGVIQRKKERLIYNRHRAASYAAKRALPSKVSIIYSAIKYKASKKRKKINKGWKKLVKWLKRSFR